jgi:hypothetical protein
MRHALSINPSAPHGVNPDALTRTHRCDWLNNQNTIFGKIVGDTVYNMLRLNDLEVRGVRRDERGTSVVLSGRVTCDAPICDGVMP